MYLNRQNTRKVFIKNLQIGGQNKVIIQSMTTVKTENWKDALVQIQTLADNGCEIVRLAILDENDLEALKNIIPKAKVPLVADIHFRHDFAIKAIEYGIDKVRINPGNIGDVEKIKAVVAKCKEHNIPIRIGVNGGSIAKHIESKYGHGKEALIAEAKENIEIFEKLDFHNYVLSIKHTNPLIVIEAYKEASALFKCPLHLGVTEAGGLVKGAVKSTFAISEILKLGIGDTLRISLSTDPVNEVIVAKEILRILNLYNHKVPNLISCPTCGRVQYNMFPIVNEIDAFLNTIEGEVKVAIMGCVVNGLGEAKNADITVVGSNKKGMIYVNHKLLKIVPEKEIVFELKKIILEYLKLKK